MRSICLRLNQLTKGTTGGWQIAISLYRFAMLIYCTRQWRHDQACVPVRATTWAGMSLYEGSLQKGRVGLEETQ